MQNRRFEGQVAIVTGASMGIGRAIAIQLADKGAIVVGCARRKPKLDVLVNNAPSVIGGMVVDQTLEDWRKNFGIGVQAAFKIMIPQKSGSIINISSVSSLRAATASGAYGGAKAALNQFSQCAAMEAAPHNVRVNVVAPGAVDTLGLNAAIGKNAAVKKNICDAIPMLRAATPEEVSHAVCFLGSSDASFITGVILPVDGGKTPQMYVPSFDITNLDNQATDR